MSEPHKHDTHPEIVKRLKRASGHLKSVIDMIEADRPCLDIAQQLQAVEKAISQAKKTLIHDHLDHCLEEAVEGGQGADKSALAEFREIARYL
jgi:DNA-binding FrmR family transcriptional regulator